ncbi:DUF2155 domain-containing protein [Magnetovibrio sp. PR-2]|uniref:DUF2155 domain-containing protein n=1 Tax=Magnetovibrio sp. PR-2 TaxID=3120356 RepID=UPI002FCE2393
MNKAVLIAVLFGLSVSTLTPCLALADPHETAVLQGLDKVTARITTIKARLGEVVRFGTLEIITRHCDKKPPEETPESAAFLDVWEVRPGEAAADTFRGWMFASSPGLNPLEHPVYDVWVKDCEDLIVPEVGDETEGAPELSPIN